MILKVLDAPPRSTPCLGSSFYAGYMVSSCKWQALQNSLGPAKLTQKALNYPGRYTRQQLSFALIFSRVENKIMVYDGQLFAHIRPSFFMSRTHEKSR